MDDVYHYLPRMVILILLLKYFAMKGKTDKQFLFEVALQWQNSNTGVLSATDASGTIDIATAPEFGGVEKSWSPEHLFLSAINGCYMTTYLAYAKKLQFAISNFQCNAIGQIEIVEGKYKFTIVNIYPKIFIADESLREKANTALQKTHKNCLIFNSINAAIFFHSSILLKEEINSNTE